MSLPITNMKMIRERKLMTQTDLAAKARISMGVITRAEAGVKISLGAIKRLADALGVHPDKLIGKEA